MLFPDEEFTGQDPQDGKRLTWQGTAAAVAVYKSKHPELWNADKTCLKKGPSGIDEAYDYISSELNYAGYLAGQSITQYGQRSDAIFVKRQTDGIYEETHPLPVRTRLCGDGSGCHQGHLGPHRQRDVPAAVAEP